MREMRRQDRKLDPEGIMEILNMGEYGVLATVMDDGKPYSILNLQPNTGLPIFSGLLQS